ncbi:MAG: hypothetical protein RLZZ127_3249, partial [Planctomycetota bacterium]|jgi:hypothetical protein
VERRTASAAAKAETAVAGSQDRLERVVARSASRAGIAVGDAATAAAGAADGLLRRLPPLGW